MIEKVIDEINAGITAMNIFSKINGLCEIIEEPFMVDEVASIAKFPALYNGKDQLKYITGGLDYATGIVFHLPNGNQNENILENIRTREKRVERTWPMKMIAIIRRNIYNTDNAYSAFDLLSNLQGEVSKQSIFALKAILNVDKVLTNITSTSADKLGIIEETFTNIHFPALHNLMVVKVEYDIVISGNDQCFLKYNC